MARPAYSVDETSRIKRSIVDTALVLFETEGVERLSLRRLADRTAMSHTIIYSYFHNKQSLFEHLQVEMLGTLQRIMSEADDANADPLERLRCAGRSLLAYARAYPKQYQFLFSSPLSKETSQASLAARHSAFDFVVKLAEQAAANGLIKLEPRTLANLAWANLHGLIMLDLGNQLREGRALEDLLEASLDLLFSKKEVADA